MSGEAGRVANTGGLWRFGAAGLQSDFVVSYAGDLSRVGATQAATARRGRVPLPDVYDESRALLVPVHRI